VFSHVLLSKKVLRCHKNINCKGETFLIREEVCTNLNTFAYGLQFRSIKKNNYPGFTDLFAFQRTSCNGTPVPILRVQDAGCSTLREGLYKNVFV